MSAVFEAASYDPDELDIDNGDPRERCPECGRLADDCECEVLP